MPVGEPTAEMRKEYESRRALIEWFHMQGSEPCKFDSAENLFQALHLFYSFDKRTEV
jgi:hypothetical protein